jgi:uncharacterized protein YidB (DUF937 family)
VGLIDVLNGMQNGPRGARGSSPGSSSSGGMSPLTMAILGLLAYKAVRSFTSQPANAGAGAPAPAPTPQASPGGGLGDILKNVLGGGSTPQAGAGKGDLSDVLKGGLGGLLAGGAAGTVLSGGLNDLLKQLQEGGQGDVAKSWVGTGPNKTISPNDLGSALGADQVRALSAHSGMSQDDLLEGLSQYLPQVIDHLTPNGRVPTDQEVSRSL